MFVSIFGAISLSCDRSGVGVLSIRRHISVALLLSFHPFGLRCDAPGEYRVKIRSVEDAQRALALQLSETEVPTYTPHPTLVEQFSSHVYTTYRSRAALFLFAPLSGI